ncbi:zf-HC2 domain-containing protein [Myxococcota bacterium]
MSPFADIEQQLVAYFHAQADPHDAHDTALARYVAHDLATDERKEIEAHIEACPRCAELISKFEGVSTVWEAAIVDRAQPRWRLWLSSWRAWSLLASATAAAALLIWVGPVVDEPESERLRPKGGWQLHVAVRRGDQLFRAQSGDRLSTGDQLGFFYSTGEPGHLAILYVDGNGDAVRLFPAIEPGSAPIESGEDLRIPDGAVLSPGLGCEWVVGVLSTQAMSESQLGRAVTDMYDGREDCTLGQPSSSGMDVRVVEVRR